MIQKAGNYFTTAYLLLMFCVYPFYVEDGYINIGEAKMRFFIAVSLAAFLVLSVMYVINWTSRLKKNRLNGQAYLVDWEQVSAVDLLMLLYATILFLSYVFSGNKETALWGTKGWYMGLVPLVLLCVLYFLISRLWQGSEKLFYLIMGASAVVFFWGICNRFSVYPVDFKGTQSDFIATLGNINWFCGFLSVVAPLGVGLFVVGQDCIWKRAALGIYALVTFMAGFAQGSDSIFLWFGAVSVLLLWIAAEKREYLRRWFMLLFIWAGAAYLIRLLRRITIDKYNYDTGGFCGYFTDSTISVWIAVVAAIGYICVSLRERKEIQILSADDLASVEGVEIRKKLRIGLLLCIVAVIVLWVILSIVNTVTEVPFLQESTLFTFDSNWGHGRGVTFYTGVQIFWEQPLLQKLIGVGPDCFAEAAYEIPELATVLREHFGSARLTNAHNEMITNLVNTGILGVCVYVGLLFTCLASCLKNGKKNVMFYLFALSIFGYFIHNMVSFAQVLNIPFLFMIMGMAEAKKRHTQ